MTKSMQTQTKFQTRQRGSALLYILIAIALLAALTVTFMEPSSQQTSSQSGFRTGASIQGQIDVIRSAIQECVLRYPNGDLTIDNTGGGTDPAARREYPINPNSSHLPASLRSGDRLVRNLRCPGNNPGNPNENQHASIFGGNTGKFMPAAPELFEEWQYYNGADGVFFWIRTDRADAYLQSTLERLDERFSLCEADVITAGGSAVDMDSNTPNVAACPANNICFRVWMIQNPSAVFQAGSDEATGC